MGTKAMRACPYTRSLNPIKLNSTLRKHCGIPVLPSVAEPILFFDPNQRMGGSALSIQFHFSWLGQCVECVTQFSLNNNLERTSMLSMARPIVLSLVLAAPAIAQSGPEHEQHHNDEAASSAQSPSQSGGMMVEQMQEHMQRMHDQMSRIRAETDPEKRQALMREHIKAMQDMMAKMHGEGGMMAQGGMMMGQGQSIGEGNASPLHMQLERRMDMMESMMQQMLEMQRMRLPEPE
ncbi:hypothetical protein QQM79_02885 [Marinobacteraceae bacterium S3BR75-40.1]